MFSLQNSELDIELNSLKRIKIDLDKEIHEIKSERKNFKISNFELEKELNKNPLNSIKDLIDGKSLFKYSDLGRKINLLNYEDAEESKEILNGGCGKFLKNLGALKCFL